MKIIREYSSYSKKYGVKQKRMIVLSNLTVEEAREYLKIRFPKETKDLPVDFTEVITGGFIYPDKYIIK